MRAGGLPHDLAPHYRALRKQEWTAIGIDFVIVVVGVFVATQVADWNNARLAREDYRRAVERLNAELAANIQIIDSELPHIEETIAAANCGLDALQTCDDSAANREAVNAGLVEVRGTNGLRLRTRALREMTTNPALLARQSEAEREHFSALMDYMDLYAEEARFYELHPLTQRVEDIPILRVGTQRAETFTYAGVTYERMRRPMTLAVPVSQACRNHQLIAAFFNWTRWQGNIPGFAGMARHKMEETQAFIAARS